MFKGIYNVYSVDLQLSAVKIISKLSKNRAHQSYLILNRQFSNVRKELPGAQHLRGQNHSTHRPKSIEIIAVR